MANHQQPRPRQLMTEYQSCNRGDTAGKNAEKKSLKAKVKVTKRRFDTLEKDCKESISRVKKLELLRQDEERGESLSTKIDDLYDLIEQTERELEKILDKKAKNNKSFADHEQKLQKFEAACQKKKRARHNRSSSSTDGARRHC